MRLQHTSHIALAALLTGTLALGACSAPGESASGSGSVAAGASDASNATDATAATASTLAATAGSASGSAAGATSDMDASPAALAGSPAGAGISPLGDANREMKTQRAEPPAQLLVTDVRTGKHQGFERVVFEFEGNGEPGWFIDYTEDPAQQGSGHSIKYQGSTALNVNIDGTVLPFEMNRPDPNIGTVPGQGGFVTEVISAGTFEGRSQFVIGLKEEHAYSVQVLKGPTRLVIDILEAA